MRLWGAIPVTRYCRAGIADKMAPLPAQAAEELRGWGTMRWPIGKALGTRAQEYAKSGRVRLSPRVVPNLRDLGKSA